MSLEYEKKNFAIFYEKEADTLFRFCLFRVSDREKALDLTQEAFTRLWHSTYQGREVDNPKALLFAIARNLIIDWYRKKKTTSLESLSQDEDERDFDIKDEVATEAIENQAEVGRALALLKQLPAEYHEVVYLRFVEGLNPRDIALRLGQSPNAVSVRITRGLLALRKLLGTRSGEESREEKDL